MRDYTDAIEQYRLVVRDDDNYSKAQDEIEKCGDNIRNTVLGIQRHLLIFIVTSRQ